MDNKSQIAKCVYTNEAANPVGKVVYYHQITLENGITGSCGAMEKNPIRLCEGAKVSYTFDGKKIKILTSDMEYNKSRDERLPTETKAPSTSKASSTSQSGYTKKPISAKQESFLGYAWSYSKDLIIAGKTMADVEELNKVARFIYEEIGKMLNNE